jgi:hypothetical protein
MENNNSKQEEKYVKLSLNGFLWIVVSIVLIVMGFFIYKLYSEKALLISQYGTPSVSQDWDSSTTLNSSVPKNIVDNTKSEEQDLSKITEEKELTEPEKTTDSPSTKSEIHKSEEFVVPSICTGNIKNKDNSLKYDLFSSNSIANLSIENGKVEIIFNSDEEIKNEAKQNNVELNTTYTNISGFSQNVVDAHIGCIGHDIYGTVFLFIMEDGTIEYSTFENMLKNTSTQGKIKGLSNIVKLQDMSVYDETGYASVVAIDKDNTCYNLADYIKFN